MKNCFLCLIAASFFLQLCSCSFSDEKSFAQKISASQPDLQQQLENASKGKAFARIDTAIVLESYKVEKIITNVSDIQEYQQYILNFGSRFDVPRLAKEGMYIYDMNWKCGDSYFQTRALVDDELGVIYDPVGSMCVVSSSVSGRFGRSAFPPIRKTKSETISSGKQMTSKFEDCGRNLFYATLWKYEIRVDSYFDDNNILTDIEDYAYAWANTSLDWSCAAAVETVHGTIGESNYHLFSWKYAYSSSSSSGVSLTWNQSTLSFDVSGSGVVSGGGHKSHNPAE